MSSQLVELSLATAKDLDDGKVAAIFDQHLRKAVADCMDRPGDPKPRTITLTISLKPVCDATGALDTINVKPHAHSSVPKSHVRELQLIPQKRRDGGVLTFNPMSSDSRQADLGFDRD
jgi:hypothetical protein